MTTPAPSAHRWAAAGAKVLLLLGSLFFVLLLCELGARLFLPRQQTVRVADIQAASTGFYQQLDTREVSTINSVIVGGPRGGRLRPNTRAQIVNHSLSRRDVLIEVNSIGLRYPELGPKTSDEYRVLVLGDSTTFGDFVPADETYTRLMEMQTAGRSKRIRFINAGLPGVGTMEELYFYEDVRDRVQPDLILLAMYLNDAQTAGEFYIRSIPYPLSRSRFLTWAANRAQIVGKTLFRRVQIDKKWREGFRAGRDLKSGDMLRSKDGFDFEIYNAYMDFGLAWNSRSWDILDGIVGSLQEETREKGSRLAILLFPVHIQVMGNYQDTYPQDRCRELCARHGIPFLDPVPALRADWQAKGEQLFYDHCHYTPRGYTVVARTVLAWLDKENLIPK